MSTTIEQKPLEDMTVAELRAELGRANITAPTGVKKETLQQLVRSAREKTSDGQAAGDARERLIRRASEEEQQMVEEARHLPAVQQHEAMIARAEVTPEEVAGQLEKIRQVMTAVMKKGVHYGEIPGVNKPTLLKPGAEVLAVTLRLAVSYQSERTFHDGGHLTVISKAKLTHIPTGLVIAEGEGLCSSYEKKYAYRGEGRNCPNCGVAGTIKKSRFAPKPNDYPGAKQSDAPGWYCYAKVGGCGANFAASDQRITDQTGERVANPDLPDTWNTVLKMADKRALVAAILNGTAASDIFTQDVEDAGAAAADTHEYGGGDDSGAADQGAAGGDSQNGTWEGPSDWREFGQRFAAAVGDDEASEWMGQVAEVGFASETIGAVVTSEEITDDRKRDLWHRLLRVLETLESEGEVQIRTDAREVVQRAFKSGFDGLELDGPDWALTGTEAEAGRPQRARTASNDAAERGESEPAGDAAEAEEAEWTPVEGEESDALKDIPF